MGLFRKKRRKHDVLKVLIIRLSAMGDVAMTVPMTCSFIEQYPNVKLSMLSKKSFGTFFDSLGMHFIGIDLKHYDGLRGLYSLFKVLEREQFDLVLDLHDVLRSNVLRFFFRIIGTKVFVIDKGRKEKATMTRRKNKILRPLRTTIERYADVFKEAGFALMPTFNSIYPNSDLLEKIEALLPKEEGAISIGVAPFAAHNGKAYPHEKMTEVVDYLSSKGFHLFFFGGDNEKNLLLEWESKYPNCISVAGKYSLKEELQLISKLKLMISMDSANMHLASLVGTTVVSVWGATHPYAGFTGWGQSPENNIQVEMFCRPCSIYGNKPCFRKDNPYACMKEISPSMIIEKVMSVVES